MNSSATPTATASSRLRTNAAPAARLAGRGSTPSSGETINRGSEKNASEKSQCPTMRAVNWPTRPNGCRKLTAIEPSRSDTHKCVRVVSCSANASSIST